VILLPEAQQFVLAGCRLLAPRSVALDEALGCIAATTVLAHEPVPPFTNSSMDGYAVRSWDTQGAPVQLAVADTVMAGSVSSFLLQPGQAIRIMTGAPLPAGADAVCMMEETATDPGGSTVTIARAVPPGNFVRVPGSDIAVGDQLVARGVAMRAAHLGVLASQGFTTVEVHGRPRVGVLSTGNELVRDGAVLTEGKIRDSNRHTLLALVRSEGWEGVDLGIVPDEETALLEVFSRAGEQCDAIITSGGVSVGDLDVVKQVLQKIGGASMRWMQVAIRPGKPFAFGVLEESGLPVFGLPGNPVSAMVSFELFVRPGVRQMAGFTDLDRPRVTAVADHEFARRPDGRLHFVRSRAACDARGAWRVSPLSAQESHQLHAMAEADALAVIPDGTGIAAGAEVEIVLLDPSRSMSSNRRVEFRS
jgi:molybdenum cofactor synthesis domain-containing protein